MKNTLLEFLKFLKPSESVAIDEGLITFHSRCKFRMDVQKPENYGTEARNLKTTNVLQQSHTLEK